MGISVNGLWYIENHVLTQGAKVLLTAVVDDDCDKCDGLSDSEIGHAITKPFANEIKKSGAKLLWTRTTKWLEEGNTTYVDASCDKTVAQIQAKNSCLLIAGDGTTEEDSGSVHGSMRTAYS